MHTLLNGAAFPVGFDQLEVMAVLPALDTPDVDCGSFLCGYLFSVPTI